MTDNNVKIETATIRDLFSRFCKKAYTISGSIMSDDVYLDKCTDLWELDYYCETMNIDQNICDSYPSRIVIPIFELGPSGTILENSCPDANVQVNKQDCPIYADVRNGDNSQVSQAVQSHIYVGTVKDHLRKASMARCRDRAPVPVILCKNKYVCRSGTLAVLADVMRKNVIEQFAAVANKDKQEKDHKYLDLDRARSVDIDLLKALKISAILDLMVENKKTKYWVTVSSSEKIDKNERYSDFRIAALPYPGCEFYRKFFNNGLQSKGLFYDWDDPINDAELSVSGKCDNDPIPSKVTDDWDQYQQWDIQQMSKHYLKLALLYILDKESNESGLLVHCISGWDRTPLLISLIRLSLWADGLAHSSLSCKQMLFFTLAYDWYLFGHLLPDRLESGEFILCFCFEFLSEIVDDSYRHSFIDKSTEYRRNFASVYAPKTYNNEGLGDLNSSPSSCNSSTSDICLASLQVSTKPKGELEESLWPFTTKINGDKENDCNLDDMSDIEVADNKSPDGPTKGWSSRMPLIEQNKPAPSRRTRRVSGEETSLSTEKRATKGANSNLGSKNSFTRDSLGRRSKKCSFAEPSVRFYSSHESIEYEMPGEPEESLNSVSKPVAVPGARMRHESSSSTVSESWTIVSPPSSLSSSHDLKFARLEDSTNTIREETTPSSSIESSQSFIVFDRKDRLLEIRKMFFEYFSEVYTDYKYGPVNDTLGILPKAFNKFL